VPLRSVPPRRLRTRPSPGTTTAPDTASPPRPARGDPGNSARRPVAGSPREDCAPTSSAARDLADLPPEGAHDCSTNAGHAGGGVPGWPAIPTAAVEEGDRAIRPPDWGREFAVGVPARLPGVSRGSLGLALLASPRCLTGLLGRCTAQLGEQCAQGRSRCRSFTAAVAPRAHHRSSPWPRPTSHDVSMVRRCTSHVRVARTTAAGRSGESGVVPSCIGLVPRHWSDSSAPPRAATPVARRQQCLKQLCPARPWPP
jgi:hypothetical protein